ncbi:MAG: hypothetical protein ACJ0UT_12390 [Candidatus Latescibacterota bacterium]
MNRQKEEAARGREIRTQIPATNRKSEDEKTDKVALDALANAIAPASSIPIEPHPE